MRLLLLLNLSLLLSLAWQKAGAQIAPADDFFHSGARFYISNSIPQAKDVVEQGLKLYPDDDKLKKLEQLLNQQQQQNQQQDQQNQSQSQQSQPQKSDQQKQQQSDPKNSSDQQKPDEQKQADQKKDEQQKQPDQQKSQAEKDKAEKAEDQNKDGQPDKPGEMTSDEAKRLLDAQKGGEQLLQMKPPEKPHDPSHPVKDW